MSALGQKRTWRSQITMSALPPKADIRPRDQAVCFGPKADIITRLILLLSRLARRSQTVPLCAKSGLMRRSKEL
jgi:hypothetical protein